MARPKVVAVVYAKGNSERVPGKNMRELGDVPLFWHITSTATRCQAIDKVVVDTDCDVIRNYAMNRNVAVIRRPSWLATNEATGDHLVARTAELFPSADIVVQLYPTSPFVGTVAIEKGIAAVADGWDSATGVQCRKQYLWTCGHPADKVVPSQHLVPTVVETTGFYVTSRKYAFLARRRVNPKSCYGVELSHIESIDIDYEEDFFFAEIVWNGIKALCRHNSC